MINSLTPETIARVELFLVNGRTRVRRPFVPMEIVYNILTWISTELNFAGIFDAGANVISYTQFGRVLDDSTSRTDHAITTITMQLNLEFSRNVKTGTCGKVGSTKESSFVLARRTEFMTLERFHDRTGYDFTWLEITSQHLHLSDF